MTFSLFMSERLIYYVLRVPDQNGVSRLYSMVEIHYSGLEPSICLDITLQFFVLTFTFTLCYYSGVHTDWNCSVVTGVAWWGINSVWQPSFTHWGNKDLQAVLLPSFTFCFDFCCLTSLSCFVCVCGFFMRLFRMVGLLKDVYVCMCECVMFVACW